MASVTIFGGIFLFLIIPLLIGLIVLQVFLSKRENRWLGLILPILTFLMSLLYPLNMAVPTDGITTAFVIQLILVWLLVNIPTIIFTVIYFACRDDGGKAKRKKQLDRMNIQDLD